MNKSKYYPRKQPPCAVLWDVDGTLIDSAEYHWWAWRETLAHEGFELTRECFNASFGLRNDTILRSYFGAHLPLQEIHRIATAKEEHYRELVCTRGVGPLPGVLRWLEYLKGRDWRQAVASSAPRLNVEVILTALRIVPYFDAIVSAEDVEHGKPDPEIFLLAASRLGTPPARCVVVEDAPAGVEGARRAGMHSIGVLSTHQLLQADLAVANLNDLADNAFDQLLSGTE